jgi:phage shock protein A
VTIPIAAIQDRRDQLAAQRAQAEQHAAELEQALALLRRNIDAMRGGEQELDRLLEAPEAGLQLLLAAPPAP